MGEDPLFELLLVAVGLLDDGEIVPHAERVLQVVARSAREHLSVYISETRSAKTAHDSDTVA